MSFKSPAKMLNTIVRGKLDPIEVAIKKQKKEVVELFGKLSKLAKTATKNQELACNKIMRDYLDAVEGAEKCLKLTKTQLMVEHMRKQLEVYEKT